MSEPAITPPGDGADDADDRDVDGRGAGGTGGAGGAGGAGSGPAGGPAAAAGGGDLRDLDARGVVEAIVASRRTADAHEARLLALAVHFVDLHPVTPQHPAATWDPDEKLPVGCKPKAAKPKPTSEPESEPESKSELEPGSKESASASDARTERIAGDGTPGVAEFAVEELGAALGVSYRTALQLVADALELCFRLPRLWALVQEGRLQSWKARQVAQLTVEVSPVAAGFVDRHLAHDAAKNRVPTVGRVRALVHEALLQCDPDTATAREETALARRGVWFDHRESTATTQMTATLDTLDALDLDNTLSDLADQMRQFGDNSPLDIRRAHALGTLAHPQHLLDLTSTGTTPDQKETEDSAALVGESSTERPVLRLRNKTTTHLYVHISLADLLTGTGTGCAAGTGTCSGTYAGTDSGSGSGTDGDSGTAEDAAPGEPMTLTGWVEKLGPATLDLLRNWLTRSDRIQLRPVLHAADPGTDGSGGDWPAVDQHDPPEWMREVVILRDGHCVFPGCTVDARGCDQDHIIAYVPIDEGGPPGQTSVQNLACLCRRHHRLKTFTAWRYRRLPDGDYEWTSPTGHTYLASPTPRR